MIFKKSQTKRLVRMTHWAMVAGQIAMDKFSDITPEIKSDSSYVTETDRLIENYIRKEIRNFYPSERIVGEEQKQQEGSEPTWYVDPIDGTAAYATELPIWSVSLAVWDETCPREGLLFSPYMDELYQWAQGGEAYKNGSVIEPEVEEAWTPETLLCIPSNSHRRYSIDFPGKTRCLGSTAYHMAMVLDGRAVGALIGQPHIWDLAGAISIGKKTDVVLRGIDTGTPPDRQQLCQGFKPAEPLFFAHEAVIQRLIERTDVRNQ